MALKLAASMTLYQRNDDGEEIELPVEVNGYLRRAQPDVGISRDHVEDIIAVRVGSCERVELTPDETELAEELLLEQK